MKGPTILAHPSRPPEFKLGQRVAIKQPHPVRFGRIFCIEAETEDIRQICDNVSIVVVIGYRYRVQAEPLADIPGEGPSLWLGEGTLEVPVVEQVIERWKRGEL